MGILDVFRRSPQFNFPAIAPNGVPVEYDTAALRGVLGLSIEDLWRTQPHLRTVVSFLGRNIAQLGLQTFERASDSDRRRDHDGVTAQLLAAPNPTMTGYDLINALVADKALYDTAIWWVTTDDTRPSGWRIDPLSPSWLTNTTGGTIWSPDFYDFLAGPGMKPQRIPAAEIIVFHGWNPGLPTQGSSPVDALKGILAEQMHAYIYRQQVWQKAGRVGDVMSRPAGVPWSDEARTRFAKDWKDKWSGDDGPLAGGTPILEDGMTLQKVRFSAHEEEFAEAAKLALATVAQVYHVNPTMIGLLDNANFSNVREFRRMLYGDTLGPTIAELEARINGFLLPLIGEKPDRYVEFNIGEKLQGSFEEQTAALSSSVGRPWMTADEARGKLNMPSLGGDAEQLVTPLNVIVGGQASPRDSAPKAAPAARQVKERAPDTYAAKAEQVLTAYFDHQAGVILPALGAKAGDGWWDQARWDKSLSEKLLALALSTAKEVSAKTLDRLGFDAGTYDEARTLKFLKAVADSRAGMINATTKEAIDGALADTDNPDHTPASVFAEAKTSRAAQSAVTLVTTFSAFATTEAAKQVAGDKATKTWIATSKSPRASHAAMDGETVNMDETFSNGMEWPGDPAGGADEVAGCLCDVEISIP